jgi:type VI protein secretion system component VasK
VRSISWSRALRAVIVACGLVVVVLFVAANFVLVDVRLLGLRLEVRLAWAVVVPAALAFGGGLLYARARRADHEP